MKLKIGNVTLENNLVLAPMAGVTDLPFRLLCKEQGAGLICTEMVSAKAIYYKNKNTESLMQIDERERPVSLQLFGSEPDLMAEIARQIEERNFDILDINMGCPVPKVVNNGEGSALMKNPKTAAEIIHVLKEETGLKVSIKFRLGWDEEHLNYLDFAEEAVKSGADELTLHARTRAQGYSGTARKEHFKELRNLFPKDESTSPLLYASGDVFAAEDALSYFNDYGMDGVMFARGAIGNPFIFRETRELLEKGSYEEAGIKEKVSTALEHLALAISYYGENTASREMRKVVMAYVKGVKNASKVKALISTASNYKEYENALKLLIQ